MKRGEKSGSRKGELNAQRGRRVEYTKEERSLCSVSSARTADAHIDASIPLLQQAILSFESECNGRQHWNHMDDTFLTYVAHTPTPA